jgi:YidC/Oxa1 family membrane protein insertase
MYNAFTTVLNKSTHGLATSFLYLDLTKPDPFIILPGLSGAAQFWASKLMLPTVKKEEKLAEKTADKSDDIMYNMQEQMLYLAPLMTILIGFKLPSGLVLYWFVTTVFSLIQQIWVNNTYGKNART